MRNKCWKDVSSVRNRYWKDVSNVAQLSNAVVQPASMLAQPSSMMAQLRIWIGCGSDLIFDRRPETSSTARFSQAADHPETRVVPPSNQGGKSHQTRVENLSTLVSGGFPPGFEGFHPGFHPGFEAPNQGGKLFHPGFGRFHPAFHPRFHPGFGDHPGFPPRFRVSTLV